MPLVRIAIAVVALLGLLLQQTPACPELPAAICCGDDCDTEASSPSHDPTDHGDDQCCSAEPAPMLAAGPQVQPAAPRTETPAVRQAVATTARGVENPQPPPRPGPGLYLTNRALLL